MRIGLPLMTTSAAPGELARIVAAARDIESQGFQSAWIHTWSVPPSGPFVAGMDPLAALTAAAGATSTLELGTAVVPTYHRPPPVMAQGALTVESAAPGRFVLGLGVSHKSEVEDVMGIPYEPPARQMRAYLRAFLPILDGGPMDHRDGRLSVRNFQIPGAERMPVLVAAMGPMMLKVAGELADGTVTGLAGPRTLESHIVPSILAAAEAAERPRPRIVAQATFAVTADEDAARAALRAGMAGYATLPAYRAMLEREGVARPEDIAVVGDAATVRQAIRRLEDLGATDVFAAIVPLDEATVRRTTEALADCAG